MAETFFLTLGPDDHRRLVAGHTIIIAVGEQRYGIRLEGASARQMLAHVVDAMGDDPVAASEFVTKRKK